MSISPHPDLLTLPLLDVACQANFSQVSHCLSNSLTDLTDNTDMHSKFANCNMQWHKGRERDRGASTNKGQMNSAPSEAMQLGRSLITKCHRAKRVGLTFSAVVETINCKVIAVAQALFCLTNDLFELLILLRNSSEFYDFD